MALHLCGLYTITNTHKGCYVQEFEKTRVVQEGSQNTEKYAPLVINTTVNSLHVVVNFLRREYPHTPPTNVCRAFRASHMVAASVLLYKDIALGALLNVLVTLSPALQQPLLRFPLPM